MENSCEYIYLIPKFIRDYNMIHFSRLKTNSFLLLQTILDPIQVDLFH
jgi:hypothetical protein